MPTPQPSRPKVKICGLTDPSETALAVELGADFLGLNFHPPSPRALSPAKARELARVARECNPRVRLVGVFVNLALAEVEEIAAEAELDLLQFHGDETPESLASVAERAIKVFRIRDRVDPAAVAAFDAAAGTPCWGLLFDYKDPDLYGGSGHSWHFDSLRALDEERPVLIAGGLGPHNIRAALRAARPWGVDICSGVEASPGREDPPAARPSWGSSA
jgi:phosphoribosylanthranilate isomerase